MLPKLYLQPSKLKFLLGRHLATNSFGLGRLFYKSSCQIQNFRRHGDQSGRNLEGWFSQKLTSARSLSVLFSTLYESTLRSCGKW